MQYYPALLYLNINSSSISIYIRSLVCHLSSYRALEQMAVSKVLGSHSKSKEEYTANYTFKNEELLDNAFSKIFFGFH